MKTDRPVIGECIGFIGFGEAAAAFVEGWRGVADVKITAYDIKTDDPATRGGKRQDYGDRDVAGAKSAIDVAARAEVIISAVTAEAAVDATRSVARALGPGQLYLDFNSCAPSAKRESARLVEARGADYVDVAVMTPVHPTLHRTPLLISGPGAARAESLMTRLDMRFETISSKVGDASTIKMVRSVMIKGIEALVSESIVAAVSEGIDERVLDSFEVTYPGMNWKARAGAMLERMVRHGKRRAEEMREAARTMDDLGIGGPMAQATAERQQAVAELDLLDAFDGEPPKDHRILARAILDAQKEQGA